MKKAILARRNQVARAGNLSGKGDNRQFMGQKVIIRGGGGVPRVLKNDCGMVEIEWTDQSIETI